MKSARKILINNANPVDFFGVNNSNLKHIKTFYPKLKITSRGNTLSIAGEDEVIDVFEKKIELILKHLNQYDTLSENNIDNLMLDDGETLVNSGKSSDVILFGNHPISFGSNPCFSNRSLLGLKTASSLPVTLTPL